MKTLRTSNYDIQGNNFFRVFRFSLLSMLVPIGNFGAGTGFKSGLVLLGLHWFGKPAFKILVRFEPHLHRLYLRIRKTN